MNVCVPSLAMVLLGIIMFVGAGSSSASMLLTAGGASSAAGTTDEKACDDWKDSFAELSLLMTMRVLVVERMLCVVAGC